MTMVPMFKKCPRCKKRYSWNPDVGKIRCPYCGSCGQAGYGDFIWKKIGDVITEKKNR